MNYFSLDVEGSEFQILKTIPFQDVDIKVLDIEIDRAGTIFPGTYEDISKYLDTQGFEFHSQITKYDAVFVKKGFLDEINELQLSTSSKFILYRECSNYLCWGSTCRA